jgi:putative ABC transport system ATP-binding protein
MRILKELHARGMTIVLVTHEPDVARHAARKVLFHDGRIVSDTSVGTGSASRIGAVPALV